MTDISLGAHASPGDEVTFTNNSGAPETLTLPLRGQGPGATPLFVDQDVGDTIPLADGETSAAYTVKSDANGVYIYSWTETEVVAGPRNGQIRVP